MTRTSWHWILCLSVGGAALWFAVRPPAWPNPFGEGVVPAEVAVPRLASAAVALDAACARGDLDGFERATTATYRLDLDRRLAAFDASLDEATLSRLAVDAPHARWFDQPVVAAYASGARAAIAVQRADGVELLRFVWDGHAFLVDGARHLPDVADAAGARAAVAEAVRGPER